MTLSLSQLSSKDGVCFRFKRTHQTLFTFSSLFAVREYALDQIYIHVMNVFLFVSTQKLDVTSLEYKPSILRLNHQDYTVKDMSTHSVHCFPVK